MALLALYPLPNKTGVGASDQNNFFSNAPNTDNNYSYDIRIDHKFTDKQSIFGHVDQFNNYIFYGQVFGQSESYSAKFKRSHSRTQHHARSYVGNLTHRGLRTPSLLGAHGIASRLRQSAGDCSVRHSSVGDAGLDVDLYPSGGSRLRGQLGQLGNSEPFERNPNSVYQYAASVSWVKGIHVMKFGTDLRLYRDQLYDPQLLTVNTSKTFTGGPIANSPAGTTGNAVAELLLGQATVTSGYAPQVNFGHQYYAVYAHG